VNSNNSSTTVIQRGITEWVEQNLNGQVLKIERQVRWRPSWFVETDVHGDLLKLYFRGDKDVGTSLSNEYQIMRVLEANDIPVPRLYGWCDQPRAIVMAQVEGEPYVGGADRDERLRSLIMDYIDVLVRIHSIDVEQFVNAGLTRPTSMEEAIWSCISQFEAAYDAANVGPQPLLEFLRTWLKRNMPPNRGRLAFLTADAPQFIFQGNQITAIHDFEAGFLGDPAFELAAMRPRDTVEPSGPLWPYFKHYMALSGDEIDKSVIGWHTVAACTRSLLSLQPTFVGTLPHPAYTEYLSMLTANRRDALLAMAEMLCIKLQEPPVLTRQPTRAAPALDNLVELLDSWPDRSLSDPYRLVQTTSLAYYARRVDELGRAIEDADMRDIAHVLGHMPKTRADADAELETIVKVADSHRDQEFLQLFYGLSVRDRWLLEGLPGIIHISPLQPLGDRA